MCGRFTLRTPASVIAEHFAVFETPFFEPRYNVAPTQPVAVIRLTEDHADGQREFAWLRWGLIPSWAKDPSIGSRMINARAETVGEKPAFRAALRRRRCLVLADGFYEWRKQPGGKQPYFIHLREDRLFAFAGLWDVWEGPDHSGVASCTILTTEANPLVLPVHDRMPVIIPPDQYDRWLDPRFERADQLAPLLRPYPAEAMEAFPVSPRVNSPANNDPTCVKPLT